jgi:inorganic pyrophosphatase
MHGWSPTVQVYKALEPGKEVEAANWVDQAAAHSEIQVCRDRARGAGDLGG